MVELGGVSRPRPVPVATAVVAGLILFSCAARDLASGLARHEKAATGQTATRPAAAAAAASKPAAQP